MKVLLCGDFDPGEREAWLQALQAAWPDAQWLDREEALATAPAVRAAVVANPAPGSLAGLPALQLIQSLWAGVDRLLADPTLPAGVPLARMVDPGMTAAMVETALWATLSLHRGYFAYAERQRAGVWQVHRQLRADEVTVTVLGQGELGRAVSDRLQAQGYTISGWQRRSGVPLLQAVRDSRIVINLLPLTPQTRGILDAAFFAALPADAGFVNLGRGAHVVEADLLAALDSGPLRHAVLDVFQTEPLPAGHAFWSHPRVTVLPHAAAITDPRSAARQVVANLQALRDGRALQHVVDRTRGY
jgi:glyoxylate/hydroxypyruvate reductase A